jgi:hypothetical protein
MSTHAQYTSSMEGVSQHGKPWYQSRLRTFLVLVLLACIGTGWLAVVFQKARLREEAEMAVWKAKGEVAYDYQFDSLGNMIDNPTPPGAAWLQKVLGQHYFAKVRFVSLSFCEKADQGLKHIDGLSELPTLGLCGSQVTDAGLEYVKGLTTLRELDLSHTSITDNGLRHLADLERLQRLNLFGTDITDSGLGFIKELPNLEDLTLGGSGITDVGLEQVVRFRRLKVLCLFDTKITDTGLERLRRCHDLKKLFLSGVEITTEGVTRLQQALPSCDINFSKPSKEAKNGKGGKG